MQKSIFRTLLCMRWTTSFPSRSKFGSRIFVSDFNNHIKFSTATHTSYPSISLIGNPPPDLTFKAGCPLSTLNGKTLLSWSFVHSERAYSRPAKPVDSPSQMSHADANGGWAIRLANENGYLSWCRNTYLATVVGVGMWAEGPSSIAFHATEGALFLGGLNLVLGTLSYLHTIYRVRRRIHMSLIGAGLHTLAALTHLGIWLTVVVTYLGYVESEEEARHPGNPTLDMLDQQVFALRDIGDTDDGDV